MHSEVEKPLSKLAKLRNLKVKKTVDRLGESRNAAREALLSEMERFGLEARASIEMERRVSLDHNFGETLYGHEFKFRISRLSLYGVRVLEPATWHSVVIVEMHDKGLEVRLPPVTGFATVMKGRAKPHFEKHLRDTLFKALPLDEYNLVDEVNCLFANGVEFVLSNLGETLSHIMALPFSSPNWIEALSQVTEEMITASSLAEAIDFMMED